MKGKRILFYVLYTIVLIAHVFVCDLSVEISMGWDIDMALPLSIALNILLFLIYIPFKKKLIHKIFIIIETIVIAVLTFAIFSNDSTGVGIILIPCSWHKSVILLYHGPTYSSNTPRFTNGPFFIDAIDY